MRGLVVRIGGDASGLQKELGRSKGLLSGFAGGIAKGLGINAAFLGLQAGVEGVGNVLKSSLAEAAGFEKLQLKVETFTGSVEAAKAVLEQVDKLAVETPFETSSLENGITKLLGAGIAGEQALAILNDIAAVASDDQMVTDLADAMSKSFAKGKLELEDVNKFLERGINLFPELSKVTGKSGKDLLKAISAGEISTQNLIDSLSAMSEEGGQFFGLMQRLSTTTAGLWSTLLGSMQKVRREFMTPISDAFKPILADLIKGADSLNDKAVKAGQAVASGIGIAYMAFQDGSLGEVVALGLKLGFANAIEFLFEGIGGAASFMETGFSLIDFGGLILGTLTNVSAYMIDAFEPAIDYLQAGLIFAFEQLSVEADFIFQNLKHRASVMMDGAIADMLDILSYINPAALIGRKIGQSLAGEGTDDGAPVRKESRSFTEIFREKRDDRISFDGKNTDDMREGANQVLDNLTGTAFEGIANQIKALFGGSKEEDKARLDSLISGFKEAWDARMAEYGPKTETGTQVGAGEVAAPSTTAVKDYSDIFSNSLSKVGGAIGAMAPTENPVVREAQKTNEKMDQAIKIWGRIEQNLKASPIATYA